MLTCSVTLTHVDIDWHGGARDMRFGVALARGALQALNKTLIRLPQSSVRLIPFDNSIIVLLVDRFLTNTVKLFDILLFRGGHHSLLSWLIQARLKER